MKNIEEEFISTLSHEIRTPLTSIKGFSQTMLDAWDKIDDDKKKDFLKIILNQSQRLINLVENVLNVAKLNSSSTNLILTKINVNNLVNNAINLVSISHKSFTFKFEKSKNELFSYSDADKVQQIILNVLDNAIKYSQNSTTVEIKTFNKNDFNVISIKNFGSFIAKDDFNKIFDKFYRVDSILTTTTQGSGLGLYIVKNLIEKLKGKIEVISSKEESFTEFQIFLPIYEIEKQTRLNNV